MKILRALFAFYINSSIHVALAVIALVGVTQLILQLALPWEFYGFILLGTITAYNFVKYAKVAGLHHRSLTNSLKTIQVFSAFCALGLLILAFQLPFKFLLYTAGFGLLTFLYAVPFIAGKNLRSLGGIKIWIVALVWAGITVIVPVIAAENIVNTDVLLLFFQRFLLVIVWILPFEIRDVQYDVESLNTMPQQLGVNNTKVVGVVLLLVAFICSLLMTRGHFWNISGVISVTLISGVMLLKSKKVQGQYYASFWVESIPVIWLLLTYLLIKLTF